MPQPIGPEIVEPEAFELDQPDPWPRDDRPEPSFAHASEAEMARILDFYRIRWEYEPHRFPILWNLDGTVVDQGTGTATGTRIVVEPF